MRLEVLISCMHQKDASIIQRTNIQSDVLIVNQCNENREERFDFKNKKGELCIARMIYTAERGLSRSRNMALRNAKGDICLICDDDEILEDDYVEKIIGSFEKYHAEDIIAFSLKHPKKQYSSVTYAIGYFRSARISSIQIALRKTDLINRVNFCEKMGSGTGNGGGEENKFLIDCLRYGAKIRYVPLLIASVAQTESQWFHGYDRQYWMNRGWMAKMIYGIIIGYGYLWYTLLLRSYKVDRVNSWIKQYFWIHKGFIENR